MLFDFLRPSRGRLALAFLVFLVFFLYFLFSISSYRQCSPSPCPEAAMKCALNASECVKCDSMCYISETVSLCKQGDASAIRSLTYSGCGAQYPFMFAQFTGLFGKESGLAAYLIVGLVLSYLLSCVLLKAASGMLKAASGIMPKKPELLPWEKERLVKTSLKDLLVVIFVLPVVFLLVLLKLAFSGPPKGVVSPIENKSFFLGGLLFVLFGFLLVFSVVVWSDPYFGVPRILDNIISVLSFSAMMFLLYLYAKTGAEYFIINPVGKKVKSYVDDFSKEVKGKVSVSSDILKTPKVSCVFKRKGYEAEMKIELQGRGMYPTGDFIFHMLIQSVKLNVAGADLKMLEKEIQPYDPEKPVDKDDVLQHIDNIISSVEKIKKA